MFNIDKNLLFFASDVATTADTYIDIMESVFPKTTSDQKHAKKSINK